jgi:hypothetical protein
MFCFYAPLNHSTAHAVFCLSLMLTSQHSIRELLTSVRRFPVECARGRDAFVRRHIENSEKIEIDIPAHLI